MSDLTKLPKQIIIDMVNAKSQFALTPDLIDFGLPVAGAQGDAKNTTLTLTAKTGSGYKNAKTIKYNRLDFATIVATANSTFTKGDATKLSDLIPEINARYNLNIQAEDYEDVTLPEFTGTPNEEHKVNLTALADSLIFIGVAEITIHGNDLDLATVITDDEMDGLTYEGPAASANTGE